MQAHHSQACSLQPGDIDHDFTRDVNRRLRQLRRREAFSLWYKPVLVIGTACFAAGFVACLALFHDRIFH